MARGQDTHHLQDVRAADRGARGHEDEKMRGVRGNEQGDNGAGRYGCKAIGRCAGRQRARQARRGGRGAATRGKEESGAEK